MSYLGIKKLLLTLSKIRGVVDPFCDQKHEVPLNGRTDTRLYFKNMSSSWSDCNIDMVFEVAVGGRENQPNSFVLWGRKA